MFEPCRRWVGDCVSAISSMGGNSGNRGQGGSRQRRRASGRAGGGKRKCARNDPPRELDLEGIVPGRSCIRERRRGGVTETPGISTRAAQNLFGRARTPRLLRHAAERDARILDPVV